MRQRLECRECLKAVAVKGKEKEFVYDGVEEPITCRTKYRWFEKGSR
jgi:hypothetical protein